MLEFVLKKVNIVGNINRKIMSATSIIYPHHFTFHVYPYWLSEKDQDTATPSLGIFETANRPGDN